MALIDRIANVYASFAIALDSRSPRYLWIMPIIAVPYFLLPTDIIADVVPVVGWIDDGTIVVVGHILVSKLSPEEVVEEWRGRSRRHIWTIIALTGLLFAGLVYMTLNFFNIV